MRDLGHLARGWERYSLTVSPHLLIQVYTYDQIYLLLYKFFGWPNTDRETKKKYLGRIFVVGVGDISPLTGQDETLLWNHEVSDRSPLKIA